MNMAWKAPQPNGAGSMARRRKEGSGVWRALAQFAAMLRATSQVAVDIQYDAPWKEDEAYATAARRSQHD